MKKTKEKNNTLIKRSKLSSFLKEKGIRRISPHAIRIIEQAVKSHLAKIAIIAKENMTINGRKTITDKDITKALESEAEKENLEV
ncbi:MAG: NFYB/HAP3 family transcription factor subunit [Candidatus Pacearchaeota archaeon]